MPGTASRFIAPKTSRSVPHDDWYPPACAGADRTRRRSIMVFDLGGVLIDWDPRHLYRKLFGGDEAAMEHFLATVCTHEWNRCQDAGRSLADGARWLKVEHPDKAVLIDAYCARFHEMMPG